MRVWLIAGLVKFQTILNMEFVNPGDLIPNTYSFVNRR